MLNQQVKHKTFAILNAKGGAGKTTLATNLAGYYAEKGFSTVLKDYDPQSSSTEWLQCRPPSASTIHGINGCQKGSDHHTRAWQMRLPSGTERVVIDTPAAVDLQKMLGELRSVERIIVPVMPSPIDIRASAIFIVALAKFMKINNISAKVCVAASRVPRYNERYEALLRIFEKLNVPVIATFMESENYIVGADRGVSVFEIEGPGAKKECDEWQSLIDWLEGRESNHKPERPHLAAVS